MHLRREPCAIQLLSVWTMSQLLAQPERTPSVLLLSIGRFQIQVTNQSFIPKVS